MLRTKLRPLDVEAHDRRKCNFEIEFSLTGRGGHVRPNWGDGSGGGWFVCLASVGSLNLHRDGGQCFTLVCMHKYVFVFFSVVCVCVWECVGGRVEPTVTGGRDG